MGTVNTHIDNNAKGVYLDWINGYGPQPTQEVLDHVAHCEACRIELMELGDILSDKTDVAKENKPARKFTYYFARIAAILIGVSLVVFLIQFLFPEEQAVEMAIEPKEKVIPQQLDSIETKKEIISQPIIVQHDTIQYAANFTPNPALETLIRAKFRGKGTKVLGKETEALTLIQGEMLTIDLEQFSSPIEELEVLSNLGAQMHHSQISSPDFNVKLVLDPGLYYWKVSGYEGLVHVGRLKVRSSSN